MYSSTFTKFFSNSSPLNATGRPMPRVSVSPKFPRPLPSNTANASFCCFIKFGLHLVHLAQEVLQRHHNNHHGAQLPKNVDLPRKRACELVFLRQTFTRVRNEVLLPHLPAVLSCPSCPSEPHSNLSVIAMGMGLSRTWLTQAADKSTQSSTFCNTVIKKKTEVRLPRVNPGAVPFIQL